VLRTREKKYSNYEIYFKRDGNWLEGSKVTNPL
jgi:hypothetical protein